MLVIAMEELVLTLMEEEELLLTLIDREVARDAEIEGEDRESWTERRPRR